MRHGKTYGYDFEHEITYDKFCLVNDAVYIAPEGSIRGLLWALNFNIHTYSKLCSLARDLLLMIICESKSVIQGTMYLDREEHEKDEDLNYSNMRHLGRTGRFVPVLEAGGTLYRVKDDKYYAVTGTKGHKWIEAEIAQSMPDLKIDMSYFEKLKDEAIKTIEKFGSFQDFIN